jgi:hypothetical protein
MRTNLDLLGVGSTWIPFLEVAGNILTDLLLEGDRSRKLDFVITEFSEARAGLLRGASCPLLGKRHPQEAHQQQGGVMRVKTFWGSYGLPTLPAGQGQWGVYDVRGAPAFGGSKGSAECK